MKRGLISCILLSGVALGALIDADTVQAQTASSGTVASTTTDSINAGAGMPDIVVTAQKRSESINKVGAPVVALSSTALKDLGVKSLSDLASAVPGLNYSPSGRNDSPVYTLRGVGFTDQSLASYPDVTVYIDQFPLPFPALTKLSNFDLSRVEVLVGPQGTLFGSNATGGAINYVTERPTSEYKGGLTLDYGRFNNILVDGYVSGPISDNLRFRLAGRVNSSDDWQYSYTRKDSNGRSSTWALRGQLDWEPTDRLSFNLDLNGWHDGTLPQQPQFYALSIQNPPAPAYELNYPKAPLNSRAADWDPKLPLFNDSWLFQAGLRSAYQMTDSVTITSLTSYIRSKQTGFQQAGGADFEQSQYGQNGDFHDFFQELRMDNGSHGRGRWTLGVNYSRDDVSEHSSAFYSENTTFTAYGITGDNFALTENTNNYAAFGALEYDLIPGLTLKGGLRYTKTDRTSTACVTDNGDGTINALFDFLQALASGQNNLPPLQPGDCVSLNPATGLSGLYQNRLSEHNLSWRAGIDLKPLDGLLLYANVSRGYKAGGSPATDASDWNQFTPVRQESVTDYELGFKAQLFDRRVLATGDIFYYDYRDKQLHSKVIDPIFGSLDATVNIPKSSVRGGEFAISTAQIAGFTPSVSATYIDGKIDKFVGVNAGGQTADFSNTPMPFVPKWSVNAGLGYKWPVSEQVKGFLGANVVYRSATNALVGAPASYAIPAYTTLDLRAGFETEDGRWRVFAYGKNVTNTYYITTVSEQYDYIVRFTGRPATYGISITRNF